MIGGEEETVPVHLEGRQKEIHIRRAKRSVAIELGPFIFSTFIRLEGNGRLDQVRRLVTEWGSVMKLRELVLSALFGGLLCFVFGLSVIQASQSALWEEDAKHYHTSEEALARLVDVAELSTEITVLNFNIHPQLGCTESYHSSVCPVPGKNRLQAIRAAGRTDIDLEIKRLWAVADLDDSMFVTDEEGQRFRILIGFGLMLDFLATRTRSVARLAPLMRLEPEQFHTRLQEYKDLIARARRFGVSLVSTPSGEFK
jgi:hypothetical protein